MSGTKLLFRNWENISNNSDLDRKPSYSDFITLNIIDRLTNSKNTDVSNLGKQLGVSFKKNPRKILQESKNSSQKGRNLF